MKNEKYENINTFNKLWQDGAFTIPLVVLIGGAAGTGKSTLAEKIKQDIVALNTVGTPIFRTVLKLIFSPKDNPYLYRHTFDLYPGYKKTEKSYKLLTKYYERQCDLVMQTLEKFINFVISEKQNYVIEGSNILPNKINGFKDIMLIEFYLSVSDPMLHKKMFSGPTHNREISDNKFENLRLLDQYIVSEAKKHGKPVFTTSTPYNEILEYIDNEIGVYLKKYYLV